MNNRPSSLVSPNSNVIQYPQFNDLYNCILKCQELTRLSGEANCMALEGCTGAGKTTLAATFASAFNRYETASGTKIPVFYVETPAPVTVKGMAARMLEAMGDPIAHRGALWAMNSRLICFIKACEVELVILDDIHHLIEHNRVLADVSNWLKVLIKETNVPFLIVGQEEMVELILNANAQLSRLFAERRTLQPFEWSAPDGRKEFAAFIQFALLNLRVQLDETVKVGEMMSRLHYATDGVVANMMNLLYSSALLAKEENGDKLRLPPLSRAFDARLARHLPHKSNPFKLSGQETFQPPTTNGLILRVEARQGTADLPHSVSNRSRARKKSQPKASDVLTKN
jgi:hypothetical protein